MSSGTSGLGGFVPDAIRRRFVVKLAAVVLVAMIVSLGIGGYFYANATDRVESQLSERVTATAQLQADGLRSWIDGLRDQTRTLSEAGEFQRGNEKEIQLFLFEKRRQLSEDIVGVHYITAGTGTVAASTDRAIDGATLGDRNVPWARNLTRVDQVTNDVTNVVGLAGAMVPAGMRHLVVELIRDGHVDALVTTGATLTHDTIEALGGAHHHGREGAPERTRREHDERLREEGVDRIYDVYLPQEHFAEFESHLRESVFPALEGTVSIQRFTEELGRANAEAAAEAAAADEMAETEGTDGEERDATPGIAAAAAERDVPVYCPAIQDSILGLQAWLYSQVADFSLAALSDMQGLNDLAYESERAGALVVGGGVPKNYVLQTMLVVPGAYDFGVQLTMDPPETGGLSGATLDEARSWGKFEPEARTVSVYADATITFPLLVAGARSRLEE